MIKRIIFIVAYLIICSASLAVAADIFCIEEKLSPIPQDAVEVIKKHESKSNGLLTCTLQGKYVDLSAIGKHIDLIVTTTDGCDGGASNGPIWVLKKEDAIYKVVLSCVSYTLATMKEKSNGLLKIKTSTGTAGYASIEFWAYDGKKYKTTASYYFDANDKKTCKKYPDICPFEF